MRLEREVNGVRLISKGGYDWTKRYSRIIDAASKDHQTRLVIDDETIVRGSPSTAGLGCDDLGRLPLSKANLQRQSRGGQIAISDFERGEVGPDLFGKACKFRVEGSPSTGSITRPRALSTQFPVNDFPGESGPTLRRRTIRTGSW
jgi:bifunctional non-homologous end joining protein LigD